jgi:hypothetical protein
VRFLRLVGFNFETPGEEVKLTAYRGEVLEGAQNAVNAHVLSLGG